MLGLHRKASGHRDGGIGQSFQWKRVQAVLGAISSPFLYGGHWLQKCGEEGVVKEFWVFLRSPLSCVSSV